MTIKLLGEICLPFGPFLTAPCRPSSSAAPPGLFPTPWHALLPQDIVLETMIRLTSSASLCNQCPSLHQVICLQKLSDSFTVGVSRARITLNLQANLERCLNNTESSSAWIGYVFPFIPVFLNFSKQWFVVFEWKNPAHLLSNLSLITSCFWWYCKWYFFIFYFRFFIYNTQKYN